MGRKRGRKWFSRIVSVIASLTALCIARSNVEAAEEKPKSCPTPAEQESVREKFLMVVSTLDGRVSALDVGNNGHLVWSIQADSRPLLSSSISKMEVTRDGVRTRLIPSLDGGLYQYDGESIEAVPMTAETLLSSSFRLADNTMMIGGKDIRTYGLDPATGQIRYLCTMAGCQDIGEGTYRAEEDLIVITRNTQTVRAVDSRMGQEKWNFSVGRHELEIIGGTVPPRTEEIEDEDDDGVTIASCNNNEEDVQGNRIPEFDGFLKIIVPEGVIVALSPEDSASVMWQHKFSSPVATAWLLRKGELKEMSLFDTRHVPAISSFLPTDMDGERHDPLLYVGMHQNQLYVQPSDKMQETVAAAANDVQVSNPRVTWRPYLNTAPSRTPILNNENRLLPHITHKDKVGEEDTSDTSLTVWHENYPFDNGYYLFPDFTPVRLGIDDSPNRSRDGSSDSVMDMVIPTTLWTWWKEVIIISLVTSVIVHLLLTRYMQRDLPVAVRQVSSDSSGSVRTSVSSQDLQEPTKQTEYESRFLQDFECLHCLGKGGFGIVFEAKNKVDDVNYAVKRICIPNREGHQERVIREVKALANLDHVGIVRFYRAWLESPPAGWQDEKDKQFYDSECLTPTPCNSGTDLSSLSSHLPPNQAMEPSLGQFSPVIQKLGILPEEGSLSLGTVNQLREGTSQEFSTHSNMEDSAGESGSFSGMDEHEKHFAENEDSFSIEFVNSQSGADQSNSCNIPFTSYMKPNKTAGPENNDSFSIVFEDSGCRDKSSNGEASQEKNSGDMDSVFSHHSFPGEQSENILTSNKNVVKSPPKESNCKVYLYIQMQLCRRETLKDWLNANTLNRDRTTILDFFDQMVSAVDYVHASGLMHRDLKPSNIFFSSMDGTIKVGDFGLATTQMEPQNTIGNCGDDFSKHTAEVGTQLYMSPEQISRHQYDHKVDIFSLGMILFELLYPFSTQMERIKTLVDIKKQHFPDRFIREMPNEHHVVSWLLSQKPSERPSALEILNSALFKDFAPQRMSNRLRSRTISGGSNNSTGS